MKPVKCPICGGEGRVVVPGWHVGTLNGLVEITRPCHGCQGKGWVQVEGEKPGYHSLEGTSKRMGV